MRMPEGERLDDAMQLIVDHSWRENMPRLSLGQLAELLPVLEEWYQQHFTPRRNPAPTERRKVQQKRRPAGTVTSGRVPARLRETVLRRDGHCCQRCGISLYGRDYSLQHRDARGMGGSKTKHTMANLVALCGSATTGCHGHVEAQPIESDRLGWSMPNGATPEEWPVLRYGASWEQPGDIWVPGSPHPDQIEMGAVA